MARRSFVRIAVVALLAAAGSSAALAQSTAITYQGQVKNGGSVVNSPSDFRFSLFTAASGGTQLGSTVTQNNVTVTDGLFTTPVDFGFNPYTSGNLNTFLQIEVRNPAGVGSFIAMGTRQQLTAAPFSLATRGINVNASGNVGIGTTTPTAPLHVFSNTGGPLRNTAVFTDGGFSTFRIAHPSNEVVALGGLNEHTLQIGGLGTSAFNPIMTITPFNSGGRVGIGTATPPESLSVGSFGLPGAVDRYLQISTEGGNAHRAGLKLRHSNNNVGYTMESDERAPSIGGAFGLNFIDLNANPGNTPRSVMLIQKQTGNVGISTTAPRTLLDVVRPVDANNISAAILQVNTCGAPCGQPNYTEALRLLNVGVAGGLPNGAGQVGIGMSSAAAATATSTADAWIGTGFPTDAGDGSNDFIIATKTSATALTNRVRVNGDNGNVGIGTDAPAARLHNVGTTRIDDALQFGVQNFTGTSGSNARIYRFGAGGNGSNLYLDMTSTTGSSFILQANGNDRFLFDIGTGSALKPGGGAWGVLSDERSKNDIQPMTGTLDRLLQLKGHAYTYKPEFVQEGRALPGMQIGLVAQEVETVFPDWVTTGADGLKQVTERSTTALMVEALRDLRTEKDAEINDLKARLEKLEALLAAQVASQAK
jgi:hypothetical protein